jgi:hypothetical protein
LLININLRLFMNAKGKNNEGANLSILEAVETLSDIADLEILPEVGVAERHSITLGNQAITYRSIQWIHQDDLETQLNHLKEIFKVILGYLREFYKTHQNEADTQRSVEGIKSIMVLVGEAAKKLDRFTSLFNGINKTTHITDWKEYKQLQDFYLSRIARHIDEGVLSKWIYGLAKRTFMGEPPSATATEKVLQAKHVFVDLEAVKKDTEYELFFMRKEDGSRFYSPRLIRNIKLVCDFGDYIGETRSDDPLLDIELWQDRYSYACARDLYKELEPAIKKFYETGVHFEDKLVVESIRKTLMALMLCSNVNHLTRNAPPKSCLEYFTDFQIYLRQTLQARGYQRLLVYSPEESEETARSIIETVQAICSAFFRVMKGYHEMVGPMRGLLQEAKEGISKEHIDAAKKCNMLWSRLGCDNVGLTKLLKRHTNGPLVKVLNILEENSINVFDPLTQGNLPAQLYSLYFNEEKVDCLHLPCPVKQEVIDKVSIVEEFKAYISNLRTSHPDKKILIINMQDRTSWREYVRCKALEELQFQDEYADNLVVATLAKDTEFYYQLPPYLEDRHAEQFIKQLKAQILDEKSGFFFPKEIRKQLADGFIDDLASAVHRIFFHNKNILLQEHRMDFIELFYAFLELKLIELTKASMFSFSCKDGVDIGSASSALLFGILKLLHEEQLSESDTEYLDVLIYGASVLVRERMITPERFKRMINAIKVFETTREEHGLSNFAMIMREAFGRLYKTNILDSLVIIPKD